MPLFLSWFNSLALIHLAATSLAFGYAMRIVRYMVGFAYFYEVATPSHEGLRGYFDEAQRFASLFFRLLRFT